LYHLIELNTVDFETMITLTTINITNIKQEIESYVCSKEDRREYVSQFLASRPILDEEELHLINLALKVRMEIFSPLNFDQIFSKNE
jgi:hypothetical protein